MNLRYGHWCQRLGLTIVSGIVATFLAPAALAAPIDEQGAQSDSSIADSQVSTSEEEAQSGSAAGDQASARDADSADAATASSEERVEEGGSAQVLTFPGASGPTRIHFLSTQGAADAILLESRGVFAMIDGGEGLGAPDGSDPRYPWRDGIEDPSKGDTEWVLGYMRRHGVTSSNLAFYLGTHAHSDHIDNADDIIYEFHPQVILTPEYSDEWITDKSRLWDNQWCYDNMMTAARWAASAYGATMQHVNDDDTHIQLGDMDVQLIPVDPDENYKKVGVRDANLIAYTAKVSAFGSSAYLAADLEARGGYEDRIAPIVGHVDLLKAGHHGMASSNFPAFMEALSPSMIVQTGPKWFAPDSLTDSVIHGDASWAPTLDLWSAGSIPAVVATFTTSSGISYNDLSAASWGHEYGGVAPRAWWFKGARPSATTGWWQGRSGYWYYFAGKPSAEASTWVSDGTGWYYVDASGRRAGNGWMWESGSWYYLTGGRMTEGWLLDRGTWYYMDSRTGAMRTGWVQVDDRWYYFEPSGAMVTGWLRSDGAWYYLSGSGAMVAGWLLDHGTWYHMDSRTGAMRAGWVQVDDRWYYFEPSGAMATGWLNSGGSWYYMSANGAMSTGWVDDRGAWYYMDSAGVMVTGTVSIDGRSSLFSSSGRWVGYAS